MLDMVDDWQEYLATPTAAETAQALRLHERTGRALGSESFLAALEAKLGRAVRPGKAGRKPKEREK